MAKLQISTPDLLALLKQNPEIELELTKTAAAQIAEEFKRKVTSNNSTIVDGFMQKAVDQINSALNHRYNMPDSVKSQIKAQVKADVQDYNANLAEEMAKKYYEEAFARQAKNLEADVQRIATALVEKKVAAIFAAAAKLK